MTPTRTRSIWPQATLAVLFLAAYHALEFGVAEQIAPDLVAAWRDYLPLLKKLSLSLCAVMVILLLGRVVERLIERSHNSAGVRYNLVRVTRLASGVLIALVVISFLFQNLYAAALSFGVISLVLGFALQAPITSFIAWLYIVFRRPFQVGDRIQLERMRGDVIEIGYIDTIIRECSGDYLGNDRQSGRIIHFPNSIILRAEVINYAGPGKPFIWNETAMQIAWTSDIGFVETRLREAADGDFAERYPERAPGPEHESAVYFRSNPRAWLEAVVQYPVEPTDTTGRRNRILRRALPALNAAPDKVQFPQGTQR